MIYLDNAATTRCLPEIAAEMVKLHTEEYGNPSSAHRSGFDAEQRVHEAADRIAKTLKCRHREIVFTSGGTESDNLAIKGAARAYHRSGKHLITTAIEHPAVLNCMKRLGEEGFEVTYLPVDGQGVVRLSALENALRKDTILVSVMAVNNETGSVQPLDKIGGIVKGYSEKIIFHSDAVQGYGKVPLSVKESKLDLLSVSAHKLHGPKGAGFLYVREGVRLIPVIDGGGQQRGIRSGTENVPGIVGCALAAEHAIRRLDENAKKMYDHRARFIRTVKELLPDVTVNGQENGECAPHIVSLSVPGVKAEVLLHALEDMDIYVSSGSACSTNHPGISDTLAAMGIDEALLDSTIRISLSEETTEKELDETAQALAKTVPVLRRFTRK